MTKDYKNYKGWSWNSQDLEACKNIVYQMYVIEQMDEEEILSLQALGYFGNLNVLGVFEEYKD